MNILNYESEENDLGKINLSGFSNIHIAKMKQQDTSLTKPTYEAAVPLRGGKSVSCELSFESIQFYADNTINFQDSYFSGGTMNLVVSGLTLDEYKLLFGNTVKKGGVMVNINDIAPELAVTFERKILGTNFVRKYVVYGVKFQPCSISAETLAESINEENVELTATIRSLATGEIYSFIDTNSDEYDASLDDWHTDIKFLDVESSIALKTSK